MADQASNKKKTFWRWSVRDRRPKISTPLRWQAIDHFVGLTSIDKNPTTASRTLNAARWLEAPTHASITVLTPQSLMCGVGGPGVYRKHSGIWQLMYRKQTTKTLYSSPLAQKQNFLNALTKSVGRRGQPLAPKTSDSNDTSEAIIYTHWPCPARSSLTVGGIHVEIEGQSSRHCACLRAVSSFFLFLCGVISLGSRGSRQYSDSIGRCPPSFVLFQPFDWRIALASTAPY